MLHTDLEAPATAATVRELAGKFVTFLETPRRWRPTGPGWVSWTPSWPRPSRGPTRGADPAPAGARRPARRSFRGNRSRRPTAPVQLGRRTGPGLGPQGDRLSAAPDRGGRPGAGPAAARHRATGAVCRYDPDPGRPVRWLLSPAAGDGGEAGSAAG
jgi:hypothetical protein